MLRELWQALGNDPFVIAEMLARPALVDRLARNSFSADKKTSGAESAFDSWWAGASGKFNGEAMPEGDFDYQLSAINQAASDDTWKPTQVLPFATGTAVWTGTEVIVWGGMTSLGGRTNTGSRYNPATDTWTSTSTIGAPDGRVGHTAVWTGTEMLVWGGSNGDANSNTGLLWTGSQMIVWGGNVAGVVGHAGTSRCAQVGA